MREEQWDVYPATGDVVDRLGIQGKEALWNAAHVGSWGFWGQGHHTCVCHSVPPFSCYFHMSKFQILL